MMLGALTLTRTCPYCGQQMDKFDYELTGGHRKCLWEKEEEEDGTRESIDSER